MLNDKKKVKALSEEYHDIDISFQDIIKASPNILVVEDDLSDSFIIEKIINGVWADCDIYKAQTLRSAYDIYKNNIIDLILLDLDLPDSFREFSVREVKSFCKSTPLVVVSGLEGRDISQKVRKFQADDFISKKFMMTDAFKSILQNNLNKQFFNT